MIKKFLLATITLVMASSCADPDKNLSCRELFDKYKPIDIKVFVQTTQLTGTMDRALATAYADTLFEYLYRIDSTYVKMDDQESDAFFATYTPQAFAYCDSIFNISR